MKFKKVSLVLSAVAILSMTLGTTTWAAESETVAAETTEPSDTESTEQRHRLEPLWMTLKKMLL